LSSILGGGFHPESATSALPLEATPLERATDSVRGVLGGLRPQTNGTQAPGPAGGTAAAQRAVRASGADLQKAAKSFFRSFRKAP
jgi:hypothetical protein